MKKIVIIYFILFPWVLIAQSSDNKDVEARIQMYCKMNPEMFDLKIYSSEAEAVFHIIVFSFEEYLLIPDISLDGISSAEERTQLIQLMNILKNLIQNPPEWNYLVSIQEERLKEGPQPPQYVGDKEASEFYSVRKKNKNRHSSGEFFTTYSDTTEDFTPPPAEEPRKEE